MRAPIPAVALIAAIVLGMVVPALAQDTIDDLRSQREENVGRAADAAAHIDLLTSHDQELVDAISALDVQVSLQESKVAAAERAILDAEADAARFRAEAASFDDQLQSLRDQLRENAIDAYIRPSASAMSQLNNSNLMDEALRRSFLDDIVGDMTQLIDELRSVEARRLSAGDAADAAAAAAEDLRASRVAHLASLDLARTEQEQLRSELQDRVAEWQFNIDQLDQANLDIESEIQGIEAELARKAAVEAARKAADEAARKAAAQAAAQAAADQVASRSSGSNGSSPTQPVSPIGDFVVTNRPVPGRISSPFGPRTHPIFGSTSSHPGIDMQARSGDPISAAADGVVISARWHNGYGNAVIIDHGDGFSTLYAHQSKILVTAGDQVVGGETIGLIGSTGWSTGPHLHFEVRVNGIVVNPAPFLP